MTRQRNHPTDYTGLLQQSLDAIHRGNTHRPVPCGTCNAVFIGDTAGHAYLRHHCVNNVTVADETGRHDQ